MFFIFSIFSFMFIFSYFFKIPEIVVTKWRWPYPERVHVASTKEKTHIVGTGRRYVRLFGSNMFIEVNAMNASPERLKSDNMV